MPPTKPTTAPSDGPSRIASTMTTRYISSGLAPNRRTSAKIVDCSRRAVIRIAAIASVRRTT